jgi:uncharacterized membrane protein YcaP (DUF421 family)
VLGLSVPVWELALRSLVIYVAFLVALRVFGKREVGQFTLYDLVLLLLIANAVQPAMTGPDSSLAGGLVIIATLVLANFCVAQLDRVPFVHRLLRDRPTTIIEEGAFLRREMEREGVDREDAETAIREHGLTDVSQVRLGVLEPDGNISIVSMDEPGKATPRRRRRFLRRAR